jgi:ADP-heptose:LPS heptosyltransferase
MIEAEHPVVFHCHGLGDALLSLPAVRGLAQLYPHRLRLVCAPGEGRAIYAGLPLARIQEVALRREGMRWTFDVAAVAEQLGPSDLLISLNTWYSESLMALARALGTRATVGLFPRFRFAASFDPGKHAFDLMFDLVRRIEPALRLEDFAEGPQLPATALAFARRLRESLPPTSRIVALHSRTKRHKMWSEERIRSAVGRLLEGSPESVVVILDEVAWTKLGVPYPDRILTWPNLPLAEALALVSIADLFVGIDSCMLHAADLWRVPGVGLFGPTSPKRFGFRFADHRHIRERRVQDVEEDQVLTALADLGNSSSLSNHHLQGERSWINF